MKHILFSILFFYQISLTCAQSGFTWPYPDRLLIGSCSFDSPCQTLDTTILTVIYDMHYRHNEKEFYHSYNILQYGKNYAKYYNLPQWYCNLIETRSDRGLTAESQLSEEERVQWRAAGEPAVMTPAEIIYDYAGGQARVRYNIPFTWKAIYEYTEKIPVMKWELAEGAEEILGYMCQKAQAYFRGRTWTVWFTAEIPVNAGPWKLNGLPGLILRARDEEGDFRFEGIGLQQKNEPIELYRWKTLNISRKKWLDFERASYVTPYQQFSQGGNFKFYHQESSGNIRELKSSWTIPYYPLEKE